MSENEKLTEEKIFEAAESEFEENGFSGARMQSIADRAGINKALLHYYYRSKDQLFEAVFSKLARKLFSKFTPIFEKDMSLEEKIQFFFIEHISFLQQNPKLPGFIINEINQNPEIFRSLLKNVDFKKIWGGILENHKDELEKYHIDEQTFPQIMVSIASLSVFPFAAKGIIDEIFVHFDINYDDFIEQRKKFASDFVIRAITKQPVK